MWVSCGLVVFRARVLPLVVVVAAADDGRECSSRRERGGIWVYLAAEEEQDCGPRPRQVRWRREVYHVYASPGLLVKKGIGRV